VSLWVFALLARLKLSYIYAETGMVG